MADRVKKTSDCRIENPSRRNFLRAAPAAAAVGLVLADAPLFASPAGSPPEAAAVKFKHISAAEIENDIGKAEANSGSFTLVPEEGVEFSMVLYTEKAKISPEFESHQHRDHVFQILEGSTIYEVGGTPKGGRTVGPGEWLGPDVEGATKLTLNKGDRLIIPRGTPHKRTTPESVTFTLISPGAPAATQP